MPFSAEKVVILHYPSGQGKRQRYFRAFSLYFFYARALCFRSHSSLSCHLHFSDRERPLGHFSAVSAKSSCGFSVSQVSLMIVVAVISNGSIVETVDDMGTLFQGWN